MGVSWVSRATWVSYEQVSFDGLSFMKKDNIITSDKGLLSVVISEWWLINGLTMLFVRCVGILLIGAF